MCISFQGKVFRATSWTEVGKSASSTAWLKTQLLNTLTALPVNVTITATPFFLIRETFYPEPLSNKIVAKYFLQSQMSK